MTNKASLIDWDVRVVKLKEYESILVRIPILEYYMKPKKYGRIKIRCRTVTEYL
jgi:hypothetical protein